MKASSDRIIEKAATNTEDDQKIRKSSSLTDLLKTISSDSAALHMKDNEN